MSTLGLRVLTAAVLVPLVLVALFVLPPLPFATVMLVLVLAGAQEWAKLAGLPPPQRTLFVVALAALGLALLFVPGAGFARGWPGTILGTVCGTATLVWVLGAQPWIVFRWATRPPLTMALVGGLVLLGVWMAIVQMQTRSPWLALAAMAVVWIADTAAYFAGRAFGRRKLAPLVSPGKTWEGVFGALAGVTVYALALVPLARAAGYDGALDVVAIVGWIAFVLAVAAVSIVGDLYESWLKRNAGVKDSGKLLPGHGGVLDRVDALLAAMPPAALAAQAWLR
jgi:phosphatidate cytidylyltransferase